MTAILLVLGLALGLVARAGYLAPLDLFISRALQSWQPTWFITLDKFISSLEYFTIILALILFIYLFKQNNKREAWFVLLAGFVWIIPNLLKLIFMIPCPTPLEVIPISTFHGLINLPFCYPSGHVFDYVSVYGLLYYLRAKIIKGIIPQSLLATTSITLIVLVGISRIGLGAHFFSQVLGGYLFGFSCLLFLIHIYQIKNKCVR